MELPKIRYATPEDYPHIIAVSEELHKENGHSKIYYPAAEAAIMDAINKNRAVIGLIGPVGDIQGIIFLRLAAFWYAEPGDTFLEELFLFVPEAYRKTHAARALLQWAKMRAEKLNVPLLIGALSSTRTKAKLKFYEKHLGAPVGGYFFLGGAKEKMGF
jgi:GNAT superfamily N-acetyltransferase